MPLNWTGQIHDRPEKAANLAHIMRWTDIAVKATKIPGLQYRAEC